jgi:hypothetical protein
MKTAYLTTITKLYPSAKDGWRIEEFYIQSDTPLDLCSALESFEFAGSHTISYHGSFIEYYYKF